MIKGQTAVITGGSRGIGAAITKKLASLGANVAVVCSGNIELAEAVAEECRSTWNVEAKAYCCDVSSFADTEKLVADIKADFGTINILINNAGINRDGLILTMKEEDFDRVLDVNLKGTFNMIKHCSRMFVRNKGGRIVNLTSVAGVMGNPGQSNYAASKAGVIGLTKTIAKELASKNITCNAVAPGFISTDMTKKLTSNPEELAALVPLKRFGTPEEVADAVAFLVSSDYITGEVLRVDGGIAI